ncbi:MAG: bifunctional proline dehydrogenase/L-glutamate gamma-semialdehyde dehydrogenase PutA [Methylocystis sp.]
MSDAEIAPGRVLNAERCLAAFTAPYAEDDEAIAARLLARRPGPVARAATEPLARELVAASRPQGMLLGGIEDFLREFSLTSHEGLAVMALAESLLRVPDDATLDRLLADKLAAGDFAHHHIVGDALLVQACAFALGLSARLFEEGETPQSVTESVARRLGLPALRLAAKQAMRLMGAHFVFGETIEDALSRRAPPPLRYSFDMLGEAARTQADAERYFGAYAHAIEATGRAAGGAALPDRPGVSVKLSALHPRYEAVSRERVLTELAPRLLDLARLAKDHDLAFTVDAEEADRLELSLEVIACVVTDSSLNGWEGFGVAVQAYQKRAQAVIEHVAGWGKTLRRRLMLRLVKGAYWDLEIKRAQERGLADYPVFTRKAMTDANYLACAAQLFEEPMLFPQFATHNAMTAAAILAWGGSPKTFEFQRLHGMGEGLYDLLLKKGAAVRVYAPVGKHRDLLGYLVRRLIENGANSSYVARLADPHCRLEDLLEDPCAVIGEPARARHRHLPLPKDLYQPLRANSKGVEFGDLAALAALIAEIEASRSENFVALPSAASTAPRRALLSPIDGAPVGEVVEADAASVDAAMRAAQKAFPAWSRLPVEARAQTLDAAAAAIEKARGRLIALLQSEGGKTLEDALAEVREAADYCRYYANEARALMRERRLPGPTGEENLLRHLGRGVFVCISPWNFSLAIFTGQIAAALVAGNAVVAKPAEQTPLIGFAAVALLHEAAVPREALQFLPGDGAVGAALVAHQLTAGVVFTGSVPAAQSINRALAKKTGPIVPLIAETGGINAMVVDSTALFEHVADDVCASAFRSAGQRCSALRLLLLQDDIFEPCLATIVGAAKELRLGDPRDPATHIGPVIDKDAKAALETYIARRKAEGRVVPVSEASAGGLFVAPQIVRLQTAGELKGEIFGPVLHVASWRAGDFDALIAEIMASNYGLTIGLHSRIETRARRLAALAPAGNIYVNRTMIGAVVGSQPFGGFGLSGTGPKAGGADYLRRLTREVTVTTNTAALGGDLGLWAREE